MHGNLTAIQQDTETDILHCIVDAMLEAKHELQEASVQQWRRILVDSCRRRKSPAPAATPPMNTPC